MEEAPNRRFVLNDVTFDPGAGFLFGRDGKIIALRRQSLAVLRHLADRANRVVGKDELIDAVWPGIAVTENSLSQCISDIRRALGDERQEVLKTVARRGYCLAVTPAVGTARTAGGPPGRYLQAVRRVAGLAVIGIVLAAATHLAFAPSRPGAPPAETLSMAVLPFADLSEAGDQAHLATGITEDLTAELARVPGLFVVSRNAARAHAARDEPPARLAGRLGVRYLLEGSVRRVGERVRVNARLVDATTAGQVWAERYDGAFSEIFGLQDAAVAEIVDALQLELVPGKSNLAVSGDTRNPEAYEAFRRGIEARRRDTVSGAVEGLVELRRALALDPTFGAAAAEMAWLYWDADDARRQVLGLTWEEVDARMHEALTIAAAAPSPAYHQLSAELLVRQHRSDEALATLRQGLTLDPSDPWTYEGLSQALNFSGRPAEARTYLESAMRVDPGWTEWRHYQAGLSAFGLEDFETAVSHLREIDPASESSWPKFYGLHVLAAALAHLDRLPEAREATGDLRRVLRERREGDANTLTAQRFFVYEREKDALRLLAGLERAGIPRWPSAIARAPGEALEGPDLRRLVLGNQLDGRRTRPSEDTVRVVFHKDGTAERRNGDEIAMGTTWLQGSSLCTAYPRSLASCGPVFRLDVGTDQAGYRHELLFETYQLRPAP